MVNRDASSAVAEAFTEEWGRIVATLIARTGDWDLAEDGAQQAFAEAVRRWPRDGVPRQPGAWLTTVARNRAVDRLRHERMTEKRLRAATDLMSATQPPDEPDPTLREEDESGIRDDRLRLMFTCCHPALPLEGRVALTLRTLAGLTTAEIARAFLVPEATMAKRLVRAKGKIAHARIPYRVPPAHLLPERTGGVLAVLYLLFNEGYKASAGPDLVRTDLCREAIRLARVLDALMPDEPEAAGLLALMLFQHSRRLARVDDHGDLVTLEEQDRSRWDRSEIEEAAAARSARRQRSWIERLRDGAPGLTSSRPRSPRATPNRRVPMPPTGRGSRPCTSGCSQSCPSRSLRSITRSPSRWPRVRIRASCWSTSSTPRERSAATTCYMRRARICCAGLAA